MSTQIQIRRDTTANWESANPVMAEGELGYDLTVEQFKVGDGISPWMELEYSSGGGDDIWLASDPDELGQRVAKFSDQISNPDDVHDFFIRYATDPEQASISRATINAYRLYGKYIEAIDIKASDSVESKEVTAAAVEAVASVALEQVVVGGIVVGDTAPITSSFSEEQKAEAMGLQSALQVIKPMPDPIPNKVTVDIEKDGNITATGAVQAADFLDADGNSIIGAGGDEVDLSGYLKSEDAFEIDYDVGKTPLDFVSWNVNDTYDGRESDFKIVYGVKAYPSMYLRLGGALLESSLGMGISSGTGESAATFFVNKFGVMIGVAPNAVEFLTPSLTLPDENGSNNDANAAVKLKRDGPSKFKYAVQAADFLDANGNPATVSPSTMVDAFTTLQTAIADETTIEGIKTALTNSLGGLIEKFEGLKNGNL